MYSSCGVSPTVCCQSRTSGGGVGFSSPVTAPPFLNKATAFYLSLPSSCSSLRSPSSPFFFGRRLRLAHLLKMITKPLTWAVHLEKENVVPIFSIDISPRGNAFATGGEDGVINVWSFAKALASSNDASLLAEIKVHEKPVNSVRFNHTGRLLASGGSDGVVSVSAWVPSGESSWRPFRKWHQQKLDVSEVAWGTTTRRHMLASCSLDGTIVIWDVERGESCHIITGHKNMVKGVAWDPLGQFLASQADAEGVFIWRTSDWKCIQQISEPFKEAVDLSDHLRLSWSPNGMYLTGVQAHVLPQPYVAVLSRDRWNVEFCIVGHRSGVSISKWNPRFFHPRGSKDAMESDSAKLAMCLCLGSLDRSFSLWLQTEERPILHMDGFFENRISDIAWSADGYTCLVASRDGCVALCNFTEEELGAAASHQVSPMDVFPSSSKMPVAENLSLWMLEQNRGASTPAVEPQEKRGRLEVPEETGVAEMQSKRQKKVTSNEMLLSRMTLESTPPPPLRLASKPASVQQLPRESLRGKEKRTKTSFLHYCGRKVMPDGSWSEVQLAVENAMSNRQCTIVCTDGSKEVWRDEISDRAVAVAGNLKFSVVATNASSLHVVCSISVPRRAQRDAVAGVRRGGHVSDTFLAASFIHLTPAGRRRMASDGVDQVWRAEPLASAGKTPRLSRLRLLALQRSPTWGPLLSAFSEDACVCSVDHPLQLQLLANSRAVGWTRLSLQYLPRSMDPRFRSIAETDGSSVQADGYG